MPYIYIHIYIYIYYFYRPYSNPHPYTHCVFLLFFTGLTAILISIEPSRSPQMAICLGRRSARKKTHCCGAKLGTQNGTLVSGNIDQHLWSPGGLILTHAHMSNCELGFSKSNFLHVTPPHPKQNEGSTHPYGATELGSSQRSEACATACHRTQPGLKLSNCRPVAGFPLQMMRSTGDFHWNLSLGGSNTGNGGNPSLTAQRVGVNGQRGDKDQISSSWIRSRQEDICLTIASVTCARSFYHKFTHAKGSDQGWAKVCLNTYALFLLK